MNLEITSSTPYEGGYSVQISDTEHHFRHRIVGANEGEWVTYEQIAILDNVRHATEYFLGILPTEVLFEVSEIKET